MEVIIMNKQTIIKKISQDLEIFNESILQEALDYVEFLKDKYFGDKLTAEDIEDIELSRQEIKDGKYTTLVIPAKAGI